MSTELTLYGPCPTCSHFASWMQKIEHIEDRSISWHCAFCGHQYGWILDGGKLDLTEPRDGVE